MALTRNTSRTFRSSSTSQNDVIADYKKFVEQIKDHAEKKVNETVVAITNTTNNQYSANNTQDRVTLTIDPIYYQMQVGNNVISGEAIAKPIKEFIYLEFGTRLVPSDTLSIRSGFKSGINTSAVALPYKSNNPNFRNEERIIGSYYFLNTIDLEGVKFLKDFWK